MVRALSPTPTNDAQYRSDRMSVRTPPWWCFTLAFGRLALLGWMTWMASELHGATWVCGHAHRGVPATQSAGGGPRQYAPDRRADLLDLALDVTPDFRARTVQVTSVLKLVPMAFPLDRLELDAVRLKFDSVEASEPLASWSYDDAQLILNFQPPLPIGREFTVTLRTRAEPKLGLYFRTPEMGFRTEDEHLWTQGEPEEARHWYPSFDAPHEKFTSSVTCRVPDTMVVLSNGRKLSDEAAAGGMRVVTWRQELPHSGYLVCLVAGRFKSLEDRSGRVPLAFWTPTSQAAQAERSFAGTAQMLEFFEREIGLPYPWPKYDQVVVDDFTFGGMENTTLTVLHAMTLATDAFETLSDSRSLVAHEMAHQWFGNLVTCKDWSHLWLNEGFATYYDALHARHRLGEDEFRVQMFENASSVFSAADRRPMVTRSYQDPLEQFDSRAYPKGAWVLHMLRHRVGEDLFRRGVRLWLERYSHRSSTTEEFRAIWEELTGRSFDRFFDEYVYHGLYPELEADYSWDSTLGQVRLGIRQTQKIEGDVLLFDVPLTVKFQLPGGGTLRREVRIHQAQQDFYFALPAEPESVRLDPDLALLAKIRFEPPTAMLHRQVSDATDLIGRLLAVEVLGKRQDADTVAQLTRALGTDVSPHLRSACARALGKMRNDAARDALVAARRQPDARARMAVVEALGNFGTDAVRDTLLDVAANDPNPAVGRAALAALGRWSTDAVQAVVRAELDRPSYRDTRASGAVQALRSMELPHNAPVLAAWIRTRAETLDPDVLGEALKAAGHLGRHLEDRTAVGDVLLRHLNSPRSATRWSAISGLGSLGDLRAVPALEAMARAQQDDPFRQPAEQALKALREQRTPGAELSSVREELERVREENRVFREELERLKRRVEESLGPKTNAPVSP